MPSTLPSSFASAAAGTHNDSSQRGSARGEGGGLTDWARRANGVTQTFRRPSLATNPSASNLAQRDTSVSSMTVNPPTPGPGAYVPPHITASRTAATNDMRYTRDQLLDIFKQQRDAGDLNSNIAELYVGEGDALVNGASAGKWGRREESDDMAETICWEKLGSVHPLGLVDMTEEERELFTTSVNSPLKAPNPTNNKENPNHREGAGARKSSISHVQNSSALPSPLVPRSAKGRRDTSESYPFPNTAGAAVKPARDDPSSVTTPSLLRRKTDYTDSPTDNAQEKERGEKVIVGGGPFGALKRAPSAAFGSGLGAPASPWGPGPQTLASPGGAFGSFLNSDTGMLSPSVDKRPGFGRGESRFRNLMAKDTGSSEVTAVTEQPVGDHHKNEDASKQQTNHVGEVVPTGSAALGGAHDDSPSYTTTHRPRFNGEQNFGGYNGGNGGHDYDEYDDRRGFNQYQNQNFANQQDNGSGGAESLSPTFTNPYQSPEQQTSGVDNDDADVLNFHLPGLGGFGGERTEPHHTPFGGHHTLPRASSGFDHRPFERQPSSTGLNRGFPTLGGLGGLGGLNSPGQWPPAPAIGTPLRERPSLLDTFAEPSLRSPGLGGGGFGAPGGGAGTIGRSSRLGALFPPAMQDQMRSGQGQAPKIDGASDRGEDAFQMHGLANNLPEDNGAGRGKFDDLFTGDDAQTNHSTDLSEFAGDGAPFGQGRTYSPVQQGLGAPSSQAGFGHAQQQVPIGGQRGQPASGSSASNQPPPAQQKTMVMPDRIRWIYRDPQGNTQGPWSGLEMHDWYRAGFFSPELLVKKQEDADYEPLAQLIRRIGNSREPFLVPQIGIPGPPNGQPGSGWPTPSVAPSVPASASAAQPPFASSFPSFGTTLTAEQQNALERRKQEEQYLMARQKEHLAQQQVLVKQMQFQGQHAGLPHQLHHHSSVQSLHSQPSFGSLTTPGGFTNTMQGLPAHYENNNNFRLGAVGAIGSGLEKLGHIQEEESPGLFQRLNRGPAFQGLFTGGASQDASDHEQRTSAMLADRARLQQEQAEAEADAYHRDEEESRIASDRYQEFQDMRHDMEADSGSESAESQAEVVPQAMEAKKQAPAPQVKHNLSLTEQVQQAASAKQSPAPLPSPWAKIDAGNVEPFPPPQSSSPLPAPAARRNRSHVADALAAESSSQRASPAISVETPSTSLAPWAREPAEAHKQPSLREIQEAEARRAAKQEEIAIAARRATLDREMATLATLAVPPAPGLPSSSNWATVDSPVPPASSASAWAKPAAGKVVSGGSVTKKTLQQIQKEEEALARKQRAAAIAVTNASVATAVGAAAQALSSGKRYADLAGKAPAPVASAAASAWTTVGASGKVKTPMTPTPSAAVRATSSSSPAPLAASVARPKPTATTRVPATTSTPNAFEEFNKWAVHELAHDLNKGIQVDDFVQGLINFPPDLDVITEAVHSVSQTMDSRHFAEEYVRRRALAEKGKIVESVAHHGSGAGGVNGEGKGWSEVARKGPVAAAKERDEGSTFKIVPAKKKGGKK